MILIYAVVVGMILGIVVLLMQGAIKILLPRRAGPAVDKAFDGGMRIVGKIAVLMILGLIGVVIWIINFG
jgi:cellobiose-specific phosphotransferase system component IIC